MRWRGEHGVWHCAGPSPCCVRVSVCAGLAVPVAGLPRGALSVRVPNPCDYSDTGYGWHGCRAVYSVSVSRFIGRVYILCRFSFHVYVNSHRRARGTGREGMCGVAVRAVRAGDDEYMRRSRCVCVLLLQANLHAPRLQPVLYVCPSAVPRSVSRVPQLHRCTGDPAEP